MVSRFRCRQPSTRCGSALKSKADQEHDSHYVQLVTVMIQELNQVVKLSVHGPKVKLCVYQGVL